MLETRPHRFPTLPLRPAVAGAFLVVLVVSTAATALEKTAVRMSAGEPERLLWRGGLGCTITYYNYCTGWVWIWSGWEPEERVGTTFEPCDEGGDGAAVGLYVWSGAPAGYGFTGSIGLYDADEAACPAGNPIDSQPFLPESGWNGSLLGGSLHDDFCVVVTFGAAAGNPVALVSDHPGVGATGPIACGACYPTTRISRSFGWGTAAAPLCPGWSFFDGFCDAELLIDVELQAPPVAVESRSWGAVKALYR